MVLAALEVCSVPNTKWPVSAAVMARRMVSRSRISPTRIASGSSRRAERSAVAKRQRHAARTSRWLIRHFFDSCTNSIGSSTVRMWPYSVVVQVVDHGRQRGGLARAGRAGHQHQAAGLERQVAQRSSAQLSCSSVRILLGMVRNTAAAPRFWLKALTRKRARPCDFEREVDLQKSPRSACAGRRS